MCQGSVGDLGDSVEGLIPGMELEVMIYWQCVASVVWRYLVLH